MFSMLMDFDQALAQVLGRPRRILDLAGIMNGGVAPVTRKPPGSQIIGCGKTAGSTYDEILNLVPGAEAEVAAALRQRKFDVIIVADTLDRHLPELLEDGGRMLMLANDPDTARRYLQDLGFELLSPGAAVLQAMQGRLIVGRKPALRGQLRTTVGMLTMNEESSIAAMIAAIREQAPDAEIVCVDSSDRDHTAQIASDLGARVLRQLPARGHGPAMELLMYTAAEQSELLIYLDCDFTYPASYIPEMRRLIEEEGVDLVNGARTRRKPNSMPWPNFLANRTFAGLAKALHGVPTVDVHSGMRAYRSSLIRAFNFSGAGDAIPIDTLLHPIKCGYRVVEMPIRYDPRVGDSKLRKWDGTVWTLRRLWRALSVGERGGPRFEVR